MIKETKRFIKMELECNWFIINSLRMFLKDYLKYKFNVVNSNYIIIYLNEIIENSIKFNIQEKIIFEIYYSKKENLLIFCMKNYCENKKIKQFINYFNKLKTKDYYKIKEEIFKNIEINKNIQLGLFRILNETNFKINLEHIRYNEIQVSMQVLLNESKE